MAHQMRRFQLHCLRYWQIIISTLIISQFLAILVYLKNSLDQAERLPHIIISGPDSFCPAFNSSFSNDESENFHHNRHIFFLETSGEACLTPRQACSVESAARANPQMVVTLFMNSVSTFKKPTSSHMVKTMGNTRNCQTMAFLRSLPNVLVISEQLIEHLRDTPLWERWYKKASLEKSRYPHVHLSDALRVAILQKRGGLYLDLDIIVLRPLHCLRNTAAYLPSLPNWVENGVLTFNRSHPFLNFLMKVMIQYYKPDMRESMGPPSLALAIKFYCSLGLNESFQHKLPYNCLNGQQIQLQPQESFYAVPSVESDKFVSNSIDHDSTALILAKSYLSHIYFHTRHKVPLTSLYGTLARQYCPNIYNTILKYDF